MVDFIAVRSAHGICWFEAFVGTIDVMKLIPNNEFQVSNFMTWNEDDAAALCVQQLVSGGTPPVPCCRLPFTSVGVPSFPVLRKTSAPQTAAF